MTNKEKLIKRCYRLSEVYICDETASTNEDLAVLAKNGANNLTLLIANRQTSGKGRGSHTFFSPEGGLYFSLLLRGNTYHRCIKSITSLAACAVCHTLHNYEKNAKIKWINDVYIDDRKVCGILCRSQISDNLFPEWIVVGIGMNIKKPECGFPDEIKDKAGVVFENNETYDKEELIADIVNNLLYYIDAPHEEALNFYKNNCDTIGNYVTVYGTEEFIAFANDIDNEFNLLVKKDNGDIVKLNSGEVSVVKISGGID